MVHYIMMVFLCSTLLLALQCSKAYGWHGKRGLMGNCPDYSDVHYCDTKAWCMEEGMAEEYAHKVAYGCTLVDTIHALDSGWHFNTALPGKEDTRDIFYSHEYSWAIECLNEAGRLMGYTSGCGPNQMEVNTERASQFKWEALTHLGYSLHPLQDKFAHMNAAYGKGGTWIKHGEPGIVNVLNEDGSCREAKAQGDLLDDVDYDFLGNREGCPLQGQWYYLGDGGKYTNSRWLDTQSAARQAIRCFLDYAGTKKIYFQ